VIAAHVAGIVWALLVAAAVLTVTFLAVCAALHSGRVGEPPRIPADVDLQQCLTTTRSITYGHGKGRA
jgi:hypothetical protein